jgi:CHAT domain-containing protein/predicted negative regulator of RcsB-dependent stress response
MMRYFFILLIISISCPAQQNDFISQLTALFDDSRYDEVLRLTEKIPASAPYRNQAVNIRAEALIMQQQYTEAEQLLTAELENATLASNRGVTLATLGFLYLSQGRGDKALELLQQAAELHENAAPLPRARTLAFLGQVLNSTGKYAQAEEQLQVALSLRKSVLPEKHELIAASLNDLGLTATATHPENALDYFDQAIEIYRALHGDEHPKVANTLTNSGIAFRVLKLYGDATIAFEDALKIWNKVYPRPHPSKAFVIANLGETAAALGNLAAAQQYFEQALAVYREVYGSKHPDIARLHTLIGQVRLSQGKFDDALYHYQQAVIANTSDFENNNPEANPQHQNFYNGFQLLYAQMRKAQAFEARYFGKTLRQRDLETALRQLQQCDSLIDRLRKQTSLESDKITLGTLANEVYADGVRIAHELSEVAFRKKKHFRELSFYFAEKSKAAVLLDAISDAHAKSFAGLPANVLEEEKNLKSALALVYQKLAQKPAEQEEKYLRETALGLNQAYNNFIRNLEQQYPNYFNLKFNTSSASIAQIQQQLSAETAVISYFIDDHNNRNQLYVYIISPSSFQVHSHALPDNFNKLITAYRNSIFYMNETLYQQYSNELYKLLIPSIPGRTRHLVILPAGRLSIIPFEALLTRKVKNPETPYAQLPYLNNRFSVSYEFSAGLILQKNGSTASSVRAVALCAPVHFPDAPGLPSLPGTAQEVGRLHKLFDEKHIPSTVWLNAQANEQTIKSQPLKSFSILHLATHGVVNEENPELSCIYLHPQSGAEDGSLFTGEIYNLELQADLVTLSACQTGLGKIARGEGVIGLSRAMAYAGAKKMVVSFWSVADESTSTFMGEFYRGALATQPIRFATALQQAKKQMLQTAYAAPFYWAPFVLIGFEK